MNGIKGYIETNVLMEIELAFYLKKKIYIWNPIEVSYKKELLAFGVLFINRDIDKVK